MTDDKKYQYFIYKLYNPDCYYVYVGSTRNITQRKKSHKCACYNVNNKEYNCKKYKTIREHDGFENWFMVVIEVMPNVTKLQAEIKEDYYRMELNATMNTYRATRGHITKEQLLSERKQYKIDNKEKITAQKKQYKIDNKEKMLAQRKQHYIDNKEKILAQNKQYRIDNKELINQKYECACGGKYVHTHKATHAKSKKHQIYISNNII
tara:strand:+ start:21 stop:644 length:624 start_codon:yes stop_codon:yes gene_type:complete